MGDVLDVISDGAADRSARVRRLAGLTRALLDRDAPWAAVHAVAAELSERRRVNGTRVREIASEVAARSLLSEA
jgi:hypothetical protein